MSLHAFIAVGEDYHLVPIKEKDRHQVMDLWWCACSPTVDTADQRLPKMVQHYSLAARKWGPRRLFQP